VATQFHSTGIFQTVIIYFIGSLRNHSRQNVMANIEEIPKIGSYRIAIEGKGFVYSKETVAKVSAAKRFLADYYTRLHTYLENRKARLDALNDKLASLGNNPKEAEVIIS
jgi:hypothetical protein